MASRVAPTPASSTSTPTSSSRRPTRPATALAERYGIEFERFAGISLDEQARLYGDALWARQPDACCGIRKVEPMREALTGDVDCWVSGIRRADSATRAGRQEVRLGRALRALEAEPARRLDRARRLELHQRARGALQPAARRGLPVDRLHALHPSARLPTAAPDPAAGPMPTRPSAGSTGSREAPPPRYPSPLLPPETDPRDPNWSPPLPETDTALKLTLSARQTADFELLANGGFAPLKGFMGSDDWRSVVENMTLADGNEVWPIPVTLATDLDCSEGDVVELEADNGKALGRITRHRDLRARRRARGRAGLPHDRRRASRRRRHPRGGQPLHRRQDRGRRHARSRGGVHAPLLHPRASRARSSQKRGWKRIVAFQTRNPIHRAHEYLTKAALEVCDGLFLHPLIGETKKGDIPADVRMKCYEVLMENYYPNDRVVLGVNPAAMRYAGPARGDLPRRRAPQLRRHALHRRPRPRGRRRLLRHLRRPGDLRRDRHRRSSGSSR